MGMSKEDLWTSVKKRDLNMCQKVMMMSEIKCNT